MEEVIGRRAGSHLVIQDDRALKTSFPNTMRYLGLCSLSDSQIADLLGLMKELNADLTVTPEMQ